MNSSNKNRFSTLPALSLVVAALSAAGCGPVNIGSDKCDIASCSGLAKPDTVQCADGSVAAPSGACVKTADGSCAWEVGSCSAECTPGSTKKADDGCNTCTCAASGMWGCTEIACDTTCFYGGVRYADGTHFSSSEGCCVCSAGSVRCGVDQACDGSCTVDGTTYLNDSPVPSGDCNTCWCTDGSVSCTLMACIDPNTCSAAECGPQPKCVTYTCADGSVAGCTDNCLRDSSGQCGWEIRSCPGACTPGDEKLADDGCNYCTCTSEGTYSCTEMACNEQCSYDGKTYASGESFAATDGCNTCTCSNGVVGCTKMGCIGGPLCALGDPGFLDGRCEACTVGADQTCNDDLLMSSMAGGCVNGYCVCREGFAPNPENGKCKKIALAAVPVCTPGADQTCNGALELSSLQGRCLFDGTCACGKGNVLDPAIGKCVSDTLP